MKIEKTKNGLYTARVYLGMQDGKRIQKRFTAKTQAELKRKVNNALYLQGIKPEEAPELSPKLSDAFDMFISARDSTLSPATLKAYISIRSSSFRSLMDKPVDTITSEDIQREINAMAPVASPKTIKNKIALLMSVIDKYALKPLQRDYKMPPRVKDKSMSIPTKEDVDRMISFCHSDPYYKEYELPILLGAYCGLRRGEIGALTYEDVDLKSKSLSVSKAQVLTQYNEHEIKAPKTYAGYRSVPLNDYMVALIKQRKKDRLPLIGVNVSQISSVFKTIKAKTGVSCRFHDLRHFFASMLLVNGVPDLYAIKLTGHSTTSMLKQVYQHVFPAQMREYEELVRGLAKSD